VLGVLKVLGVRRDHLRGYLRIRRAIHRRAGALRHMKNLIEWCTSSEITLWRAALAVRRPRDMAVHRAGIVQSRRISSPIFTI